MVGTTPLPDRYNKATDASCLFSSEITRLHPLHHHHHHHLVFSPIAQSAQEMAHVPIHSTTTTITEIKREKTIKLQKR
jgi:hypothetical protein